MPKILDEAKIVSIQSQTFATTTFANHLFNFLLLKHITKNAIVSHS